MATVKKNDFIELEFTGKANNEVFDTTSKEEAKKMGLDGEVKPLVVSVGNHMLLKSFDEYLEGKEVGKKYTLNLEPEKAFGKRNPSMIKTVPIKIFHEKNMNPYPGMAVQLDQYIAKILSVSGGRVIVDFNNPVAGKDVTYEFTIKRIIEDNTEKVNALQDFFFKTRLEFELKDKKVIFKESRIKPFIEVFGKQFHDITGLDFEVSEEKKEKSKEKEEKKE